MSWWVQCIPKGFADHFCVCMCASVPQKVERIKNLIFSDYHIECKIHRSTLSQRCASIVRHGIFVLHRSIGDGV